MKLVNLFTGLDPFLLIDLLRKSLCHREHREKEFFSEVCVNSVAK